MDSIDANLSELNGSGHSTMLQGSSLHVKINNQSKKAEIYVSSLGRKLDRCLIIELCSDFAHFFPSNLTEFLTDKSTCFVSIAMDI